MQKLLSFIFILAILCSCSEDSNKDDDLADTETETGTETNTSSGNGNNPGTNTGNTNSTNTDTNNGTSGQDGEIKYSEVFTGGMFHLGPVDWSESEWTNAFGPYPKKIQQVEGTYLGGLELSHTQGGELCDACIQVNTNKGKSLILRIVTYGYTSKNSIDVSPEAYKILNSGEWPRNMSWYVTKCPDNGENIYYQLHEDAHVYWISLWIRNIRIPLKNVVVISSKYPNGLQLKRKRDGTYSASGSFNGSFKIRATAIDGQVITDNITSLQPGSIIKSSAQFK